MRLGEGSMELFEEMSVAMRVWFAFRRRWTVACPIPPAAPVRRILGMSGLGVGLLQEPGQVAMVFVPVYF
jgi:hypothetical protein